MSAVITGDQTSTVGLINSKTAIASTSGTSIDFTGIPAGVKRITVMFNGVSLSGTSNYLIQIGAGSIDATSYNATSALAWNGSATIGASFTTGFGIVAQSAANSVSGSMILLNVSGNIWVANHSVGYNQATSSAGGSGGGIKTLSGTLDRIRITTVNGTDTFDAGSINILYE